MSRDGATFHATRVLAATPSQVWAAFADPGRLARWWGPAGFTNVFEVFDFRPGGHWVFEMVAPDGTRHSNRSSFEALAPDARVCVRHESPPRFRLDIVLTAVGGGTRVDWTQTFDDLAVAEALAAVVEPANEQNLDRLAGVVGEVAGVAGD